MTSWEYARVQVAYKEMDGRGPRIIYVSLNGKEQIIQTVDALYDFINSLGHSGWELVNTYTWGHSYAETYIFKRAISN